MDITRLLERQYANKLLSDLGSYKIDYYTCPDQINNHFFLYEYNDRANRVAKFFGINTKRLVFSTPNAELFVTFLANFIRDGGKHELV